MSDAPRFERCENCWFRSGPHTTNGGGTFHECRINPPVVFTGLSRPDFEAVFPRILLTDFCGKFEHRVPAKETT